MEINEKLEELKTKMVSGEATATEFEQAIKEQGLTVEVICLLRCYYESDFVEEQDKTDEGFMEAVADRYTRENEK